MKRRAFSQIMAIITISVLILLTLIIMVIVYYIQKMNAIVDYANEQVVYTISLSQHVDEALNAFFKYNTFKQVDEVNRILNLNSAKMSKDPDNSNDYLYVYYQPLYKDYLENTQESKPWLDVRWVWITSYMINSQQYFPYLKQYVENMNVPPFVQNQTFKYSTTIPFYKLDSLSEENPLYYKLVPEFYNYHNLLFLKTAEGFKIITSNYTVEVTSKATVSKSDSGGTGVYFDKGGDKPFMTTRDIHAGEFLIDFRIIQMYNAMLFQYLSYYNKLKQFVNEYAYIYIIPNDNLNENKVYLASQLIDKIPYKDGHWHSIYDATSGHIDYNVKVVNSEKVGKYGKPVASGLSFEKIPNFDWFIYNILFTPPYTIEKQPDKNPKNMDYVDIGNKRIYIPFSLYSPITNNKERLYVGNTQWILLPQNTINKFISNTNANTYGAEALYALTNSIAHIKEFTLKDGVVPYVFITDSNSNKIIMVPNIGNQPQNSYFSYTFKVISPETINLFKNDLYQYTKYIPYTGIVWVNDLSTIDINNLFNPNNKEIFEEFKLYNILLNNYILSNYDKIKNYWDTQNTQQSDYLIQQINYHLYLNYRALPYTTALYPLMKSMSKDTFAMNFFNYERAKEETHYFITPDLYNYKDSIQFLYSNILNPNQYNNPNIYWSYTAWDFSNTCYECKVINNQNTKTPSLKSIYPITPVTMVENYPWLDFTDSIQLWWLPIVKDKINNPQINTRTDLYNWKTIKNLDRNMIVKISPTQTAKLKDIVGGDTTLPISLGSFTTIDSQENSESITQIMYDDISISKPVVTDVQYKVDNIKIHYYYAPIKKTLSVDRYTFSQSLTHTYNCRQNGECCTNYEWNETLNETVCTDYGTQYTRPPSYGSHTKDSYTTFQFSSADPSTTDKYQLHIYKNFDTGEETILGKYLEKDLRYYTKVKVNNPSDKNYFTKYFFLQTSTSHTKYCGCENDKGEFKFNVNYGKIIMKESELYYVIEVAEIDLKLRITFDLYATDLRFLNNYLGLWKKGIKEYPYYNTMYIMNNNDIIHITTIGDTASKLATLDKNPNYNELIFQNFITGRYIDPNFLIGKNLYVKSKFMIEIPIKIYIITRYYYGTPARLNTPQMTNYIKYQLFTRPTTHSTEYFDITYYKQHYYYTEPMSITEPIMNCGMLTHGIPLLISPEGTMLNQPLGIPQNIQTTFKNYCTYYIQHTQTP